MKKIVALLAALCMSLAVMGVPTANALPAEAPVLAKKAWGTSVSHASDDSGYTGDIKVVCSNGKVVYLSRGDSTFAGSDADACSASGVDRIVVAYNQTVYCKNYVYPYQNTYFYTGTNYMGSNQTWKCYSQRPL